MPLSESDVERDPIAQFQKWFAEAAAVVRPEPSAVTLATANAAGLPSARVVLLKGVDDRGFVFYTNYNSRKGRDLAENPRATLLFYWGPLERQVRVEGVAEQVSAAESDAYFRTRAPGSQLGAWASDQSSVIASRDVLAARLVALQERFGTGEIPRPPHWGGYRVVPEIVELWQGRPDRLHDRLRYRREGAAWVLERLSP